MTQVVIEGNSLGTGKVTLKAPNVSEDLVFELPSVAGPIGGFPSGTKMLFVQSTAPVGWTKDVVTNDVALRVVSGVAGSGGTVNFSTGLALRNIEGSTAGTTLTSAQMPSHRHQLGHGTQNGPGGSGWNWKSQNAGAVDYSYYTGGGEAHDHALTGVTLDMAIKYVDVIIATKD